MTTSPYWSTAAQKLAVGQETEFSPSPESMVTGGDHAPSSKVTTLPLASTAAQKAVVGQETEVRNCPESISTGGDQVLAL